MNKFEKDFLLGAATSAHQVEGNNIHSDYWVIEQLPNSDFDEPSLDSVDHYHRYEEDIALLSKAGLNAYRFSMEWARIEPEKGKFDNCEIEHYSKVLSCCHENGITPIVTMHHISSPKWLITEGGWENESTVEYFKNYCIYIVERLGGQMEYISTINCANAGINMFYEVHDRLLQMGIDAQPGVNLPILPEKRQMMTEAAEAFGLSEGSQANIFLSPRTEKGGQVVMHAHEAARDSMKALCPHLKVGIILSLCEIVKEPGNESKADALWEQEFKYYLPFLQKDDFFGINNYTRKVIDANGTVIIPEGAELTDQGYEYYPEGLGNVIRRVANELPLPIIVTESGVATMDDTRRVEFIQRALEGVQACIVEGIPVKGYMYWSLLDNYEWYTGFAKHFGLIGVDRRTQNRKPKHSLSVLGSYCS